MYRNSDDNITFAIFITTCIVLALIAIPILRSCDRGHGDKISEKLRNQATSLGFHNVRAICDDHDSDGDGKVSCTLVYTILPDPEAPTETRQWLCPSHWSMSSTCQVGW